MVGKWMKLKMALGLKMNPTVHIPTTDEHFPDALSSDSGQRRLKMPTTPTPSSSGLLRLPKHSSKKFCAICLETMKPGQGHAIFTAECSHSFHFHCIASNVRHGKHNCPVCRAKWKEVPLQSPGSDKSHRRETINNVVSWPREATRPSPRMDIGRNVASHFRSAEPARFDDDDEIVREQADLNPNSSTLDSVDCDISAEAVEVKTYTELPSVPKLASHNDFSILIHLKAPVISCKNQAAVSPSSSQTRAPVDLVTVLDVSGSMAGTKIALLKRAMGFVIQNLAPSDRLSVIAFSSTSRRLFPLHRMSETGKREAIQAVNSLSSNGGTNISEALRKGAKVITDRKWKNPVSSIILLSDGQDTYNVNNPSGNNSSSEYYPSLLPISMHRDSASSMRIPVHAFGFGTDHDAVSMHSISETSGGTFSFIEAESAIQDAFAQCIGGILSVVVQNLEVEVDCIDPMIRLKSMKAGSYETKIQPDSGKGCIKVGDLYAEEERDFLVTVDVPACECRHGNEMSLLQVRCIYKHPITSHSVNLCPAHAHDVIIERPLENAQTVVSVEVDKQRNRLRAAEAMSEAKAAAERGDLGSAAKILESCRGQLSETVSARAGDRLCAVLDAELREMQERMASKQVYEASGRAYVLSGLSSHSWQRATARGDSTSGSSLVQAYQTPAMVDMVNLSQSMVFGNASPRPKARSMRSFTARPQPR